jgi:tetratricopeptide (TPR) repeat protein
MSKGEYDRALSMFGDAEKAMDNEDTEFKKNLYKMMSSAYMNLGKKKDMAKYLKKAIAISDVGEERISMQSQLVSYSKENGDLKSFETETLQLVRDICQWRKISVGDCWKKSLRDATIADAFTDLAVRFEKKYQFQKFYTYYYYGAAWGNETAREYCRKVSAEYWNEPVNKIVL